MTPTNYFDFTFWRMGFALSSNWMIVQFDDGSKWYRVGLGVYWRLTHRAASEEGMSIDIDELANEIRRVDGNHDLGAGALAEALAPWIENEISSVIPEVVGWTHGNACYELDKGNDPRKLEVPAVLDQAIAALYGDR